MHRLDDVAAQATARGLDETLAALQAEPDSRAQSLALEAIDAILEIYGEGIARLLDAHRAGRLSDDYLGADEVLSPLLAVHDLLPRLSLPSELVQLERRNAPPDEAQLAAAVGDASTECQICAATIDADHRHLLDVEHRQLMCACRACAILFDGREAAGGKYRLVPRRYRRLERSLLDGGLWERLELPVDVVFMFMSSSANRPVAFYPGPMGTTESALPLPAWDDVVAASPVLAALEPDVEAVLVRRTKGARDYLVVPVDECYRLAGAMRTTWQGISGGDVMRRTVDTIFRRLATQCDGRTRAASAGATDLEEVACKTI